MKILHTSDWHLGKRIEGKERYAEQRAVLDELKEVIKKYDVSAVINAGDVFDVNNPPAEAEELFYSTALEISRLCPFIAVAGNHDSAERLNAPHGIASVSGIVLVGTVIENKKCGNIEWVKGGVKIKTDKGNLNVLTLPFPSAARLGAIGHLASQTNKYDEMVKELFNDAQTVFSHGEVNVAVSHLFLGNATQNGDEVNLGTASILPKTVLPDCDYVALGHIHKAQVASKSKNAYYSGSILEYNPSESGDKYFLIYDSDTKQVEKVKINSGRKIVTVSVKSFDEAVLELERNSNSWVYVDYYSAEPISASEYAELRRRENFCKLTPRFVYKSDAKRSYETKTDAQRFIEFYEKVKGEKVPSDVLGLFNEMLGEITVLGVDEK